MPKSSPRATHYLVLAEAILYFLPDGRAFEHTRGEVVPLPASVAARYLAEGAVEESPSVEAPAL